MDKVKVGIDDNYPLGEALVIMPRASRLRPDGADTIRDVLFEARSHGPGNQRRRAGAGPVPAAPHDVRRHCQGQTTGSSRARPPDGGGSPTSPSAFRSSDGRSTATAPA